MGKGIYELVFLALKEELEDRGYKAEEIEALMANYSWLLSEHSLLTALLRSRLPVVEYQRSLDFLVNRHQALGAEIEPGSTVLDIGCGLGILACFLAGKNCRVYGIDIEEQNVGVARRLAAMLQVSKACTFQKTESHTLAFNPATFDYVVLSWTLHEIRLEDRQPLAAECARVLKHGGRLLILDPESQLDFDQLQDMMSKHPMDAVQRKALSEVYDHGAFSKAILAIYRKERQEKE